jgi:hypothetical protein
MAACACAHHLWIFKKSRIYPPCLARQRESGARSFPSHLKSHQPLILNKRKKSLRPCIRNSFAPPADSIKRRRRERGLEIAKIWTLAVALMEFLMKERENAEATRQLCTEYIDGTLSAKLKLKHAGSLPSAFLIINNLFFF